MFIFVRSIPNSQSGAGKFENFGRRSESGRAIQKKRELSRNQKCPQ